MVFNLTENITITEVIDEILEKNGLEESAREFFNASKSGKEPRAMVVRDTLMLLAQKKVPEHVLVNLLEKHLKTSKNTAEQIIKDIKEKLLSFSNKSGDVADLPEQEKQALFKKAKEELLRKIGSKIHNEPATILPKENLEPVKPKTSSVEENAKHIKNNLERTEIKQQTETPKPAPDPYKESIE